MDMYKLKFTKLQNEIFRLLCIKVGHEINQRTVAELLNVSPTAISKAIRKLEKEKLVVIKRNKRMKLNHLKLNRENSIVLALKRVENLKQFYESGLVDFLDNKFPGCTIILFGSYSLGEDTINSDIDIAIVDSTKKELNLSKFSELLERKIFLHFYENINKISKNLKSNILNGITIKGGIEF